MSAFDGVPVVLVAAQIRGGKRGVGPLGGVVDSPVKAVDVQLHVVAVAGRLAHGQQRLVGELVADVLGLVLAPDPGIVEIGAEGDRIERIGGPVAEQREIELAGTVRGLEDEAERVLLKARVAPHAPLHPQGRVDLERLARGGIEILQRRRHFHVVDRSRWRRCP